MIRLLKQFKSSLSLATHMDCTLPKIKESLLRDALTTAKSYLLKIMKSSLDLQQSWEKSHAPLKLDTGVFHKILKDALI
jgi:hypothetical protein